MLFICVACFNWLLILPDFNNPESISAAIDDLLSNPEKIDSIKKEIKPFKEQMRWQNVARKYIDIERKLINS